MMKKFKSFRWTWRLGRLGWGSSSVMKPFLFEYGFGHTTRWVRLFGRLYWRTETIKRGPWGPWLGMERIVDDDVPRPLKLAPRGEPPRAA